ncbi:salt tolerance down-regulator-domain-containing protein [Gigaspora rosea]|uniref:Stress response protein NST1 n=1 Tax=Gigaspora rosea TaxID=44941 RepID=A0A397UFG7_9GLOM|nr:salt tolerance down-regulator-domain-containing protein [Gigaspora rosea]
MADIHHSHHHKDGIWNTNNNEERQRIKEFWLQLGEEEQQSLVKFEKKAVLKKMKEQQKHSCLYSFLKMIERLAECRMQREKEATNKQRDYKEYDDEYEDDYKEDGEEV